MTQLNPNVVELLNDNTVPMVNNFNKIVSWLLHGQQSEHKMPPALLAFLESYAGVQQQAQETAVKLETMMDMVEALNGVIQDQETTIKQLNTAVADLSKQVVALSSDAPKTTHKRGKKSDTETTDTETTDTPTDTAEVVATEPVVVDEVSVTAEAVGAGEVEGIGLEEISNMLEKVLSPNTPAMTSL